MAVCCQTWIDRLLLSYRDHLGIRSWPLQPYDCEIDGPTVRLVVKGGGIVTGRASAWKLLAGRYWGQTFSPEEREHYSAWIPTLRYFGSSSRTSDMLRDERVLSALLEASRFFAQTGQDWESVLCLLQVDRFGQPAGAAADHLSKPARERFEPPRAFEAAYDAEFDRHCGVLSINQFVRFVKPWLGHDDPLERIEAGYAFGNAMSLGTHSGWLRLEKELRFVFEVAGDAEPLLSELGLGMVEYVAWQLVDECAYAEALPYLDRLLQADVGPAVYLAQRWECHSALGNRTQAAADWQRLCRLRLPWAMPPEHLQYRHCEPDNRELLRAAGLARAAVANVRWAERRDPCEARRCTKAFVKGLSPPATYLSLAREQIAEAESLLPALVRPLPEQPAGWEQESVFLALAYVHGRAGEVHELAGERERALAAYLGAVELLHRMGYQHSSRWHDAVERLRQEQG